VSGAARSDGQARTSGQARTFGQACTCGLGYAASRTGTATSTGTATGTGSSREVRQPARLGPRHPRRAQQRAPLPPRGLPLRRGRRPRVGFGIKRSPQTMIQNGSG
jgi:hypothetical protein